MSIQIRLKVETDIDEDSDIIELLEELYLTSVKLGVSIVADYNGNKIAVNSRGHAFLSDANNTPTGWQFYRRTPRQGWVTAKGAEK